MKTTVQAIILAAGKSSRFNTTHTKLAQPICGQPMILFSTKLLASLDIATTVVVGHEKEIIKNILSLHHGDTISYAIQEEQLGTGHALMCSQSVWDKEHILVINGDMPLVTQQTIIDLLQQHKDNNAAISFVSACTPDKQATQYYGRVITKDNTIAIVEAKDFAGDPSEYCCINAGIYVIKKDFLSHYIKTLNNNNAHNEFYITDLVKIASENNLYVTKVSASFDTIRGINTLEELRTIEGIKKTELISYWMNQGVRFAPSENIYIDINVTIGQGSVIADGVHLRGKTSIGNNVHIHPYSIINDCVIDAHTQVGPFAYMNNNMSLSSLHNTSTIKKIIDIKKQHSAQEDNGFVFTAARLLHHDIPTEEQ